ncbi:hypothetical protein NFI96_009651 [Prochilodus magdalenae]|nr:hypothetical protein NFI96_009651 [Prochilodus magdalenae]
MIDLPKERTEPTPPFTYCGMDCFGPFVTQQGKKQHKSSQWNYWVKRELNGGSSSAAYTDRAQQTVLAPFVEAQALTTTNIN